MHPPGIQIGIHPPRHMPSSTFHQFFASSPLSPTTSKMHVSSSSSDMPPSASSSSAAAQAPTKPKRVDTQDLKSKLATALGGNGKRYWAALLDFMTAKIDRTEFEEEAVMCLKLQHVHLHNSLVLGLLYNASADVPGPSTRSGTGMLHERDANGQLVDADGNVVGRFADADDDLEMLQPAKKRLRLLTAGLSRKERARIRNIPKQLAHSRSLGLGGSLSLGWAGAGADMLEKKRKEEEKRRSAEEKQRVKEAYTEIGLPDWKAASLQDQSYITSMHDRLPASTQQEISRALTIPLCIESKQLPDLESMRDLMTLQAVEAGLVQGTQPQAAALLLAALQCHLQNVMASIITKIRANRQMGIRTTGIRRSASDDFTLVTEAGSDSAAQAGDDSFATSSGQSPAPHRPLRAMLHDTSSISSSSVSMGIMSGADSSMMSLASTAPTSVPPGSIASSENASSNDAGTSSNTSGAKPGEEDDVGDASTSDVRDSTAGAAGNNSSLELRHLAFLLGLAPHTVVESLGQGAHERLLAADWTHVDEDAQREHEWSTEGLLQHQARLSSTAKLSSVVPASSGQSTSSARSNYIIDQLAPVRLFDRRTLAEKQAAANPKIQHSAWNVPGKKGGLHLPSSKAAAPPQGPGAASSNGQGRGNETSVDKGTGQSPDENKIDLAAIIASRYGAQTGATSLAAAAASASAAQAVGSHHRGQDPHLYDVVDPVALLASLVA